MVEYQILVGRPRFFSIYAARMQNMIQRYARICANLGQGPGALTLPGGDGQGSHWRGLVFGII